MALADFETSAEFSDLEKLALRYAGGMTETPVHVSDGWPRCGSISMRSSSWS